jgi:hypothetical protein
MRCAAAAWLLLAAGVAQAKSPRLALLIGANAGAREEVELRYAERDAQRIADILRSLGDFEAGDLVVLAHPSPTEVRQSLDRLRQRLDPADDTGLLVVFYSGHADAESLHLGSARLPLVELRESVARSGSGARVLVVDACRSGTLTRVKGGKAGPTFDVDVLPPPGPHGFAILTSSAAGEDSQESDALESSLFTHYLASALLGAGDKNDDGAVTVDEAFAYASERTVASTGSTQAGPQHPTFSYDLSGREQLVLTRPGARGQKLGALEFRDRGWFVVQRDGGAVVAELNADRAGKKLALEAGRYRVTQRFPDYYLERGVAVEVGGLSGISLAGERHRAYPKLARKGEATPLSRKWWLWTSVAAVAAAVAIGVGVGVGLSSPHQSFNATLPGFSHGSALTVHF